MEQAGIQVRPVARADRTWVAERIVDWWMSPVTVSDGRVRRPAELNGFIALIDECFAGLVTLAIEDGACVVVTLNSMQEGVGVGTALLQAVEEYARRHGCARLRLVTTNDNTRALRFYQRWGMRVTAWRIGTVVDARRLKPEIPLTGNDGIPLLDEIELSKDL
jgi:GNAT superfamily N-acetyltransferase